METIIRPFQSPTIDPQPYHPAGQQAAQLVHVAIGARGGTKTFASSGSASASFKMGQIHREKAPASQSLQSKLSEAAS